METIQFEVRTGRTKTSIYEDIATVYGYTPTIEEIQDKTQENTYLETKEVGDIKDLLPYGAYNIFIGEAIGATDTTIITTSYKLKVQIANPETIDVFSKKIIQGKLTKLDLDLELKATIARSTKTANESEFKIV